LERSSPAAYGGKFIASSPTGNSLNGLFCPLDIIEHFQGYVSNKIIYLLEIQALAATESFRMQYFSDSSSFFAHYQLSAKP
jgi:hypothetical protein